MSISPNPATTFITVSIPAPIPASSAPGIQSFLLILSSPPLTHLLSPKSIITVSISVSSSPGQPRWKSPTLEEFEADIKHQ